MHSLGRYLGAQRGLDGGLIVSFEIDYDIDELQKLQALKESQLVIDVQKFRDKRSDRANRYCWKLCDLIAKALLSTKDTIYLMKLKEYGVFEDYEIPAQAISIWRSNFKVIEPQYYFNVTRADMDGNEKNLRMVCVRCWKGSHEYDSKQMSDLIEGIVHDAREIGIDTWSQEEVDAAVAAWESR